MLAALAWTGCGSSPEPAKKEAAAPKKPEKAPDVYKVNLDAIQDGDLRTNLVLEGGDVVVVPPTVSASIGNAIRGFFYPVTAILGIGGPATRAVLY